MLYNERVRHARDADGKYPFKVDSYRILSIGAASGRTLLIMLAEKANQDPAAKPWVRYKRTRFKPLRDRAGNQGAAQVFRRTKAHGFTPGGGAEAEAAAPARPTATATGT